MRVTFLGTGAPLHPTRRSTGLLFQADGVPPLLIDACSGMEWFRALAEADVALNALGPIVLTHGHGDHIGGTMGLPLLRSPVHLHGPPAALDAVQGLIQHTYGEFETQPDQLNFNPMQPGETYTLAEAWRVQTFAVPHRVPTYALRVTSPDGMVVAFSADGQACDAMIDCARDADLFICDALVQSTHERATSAVEKLMHPTAQQAGEMAQAANAKALALVHLARFADPQAVLAEAQASTECETRLPEDRDTWELFS